MVKKVVAARTEVVEVSEGHGPSKTVRVWWNPYPEEIKVISKNGKIPLRFLTDDMEFLFGGKKKPSSGVYWHAEEATHWAVSSALDLSEEWSPGHWASGKFVTGSLELIMKLTTDSTRVAVEVSPEETRLNRLLQRA
jgi:hypothetical protein